jgi:ATP-dependent DNA helicase RecQ
MPSLTPIDATLERVFGFTSFRPYQRAIVEDLVAGRDAFVLLPTGGGKSLCYQLPALLRSGTAIVVSPLIALMKDQVDALVENGVAAACYNSALDADTARRTLARLHAGDLDLLYVAPERLLTDGFLERLDDLELALFAIDEAHCVSQWGHDFRPEYAQLGMLADRFRGVPRIALTATADPQTREDIVRVLGLGDATRHVGEFDRANIRYTVASKADPARQLERFLAERPDEPGIVYALSRKRVEEVANRLANRGLLAAAYHAGLPKETRHDVQERFLRDELQVVVATVAFGMGIDKPNVRFVVHYDLPRHLEGYYQETGRAGRDGLPSEALLLFGMQDVVTARRLIEQGDNAEQQRIEVFKLNAMLGYAESLTCRRRVLLRYFGESLERDCGNCDVCLDPPATYDATEDARKALSCVYRVGQRFGLRHVVDVLRGAESARIQHLGHDRLSTYGIGAERSVDEWSAVLRQLVHRGYLDQDVANYAVLRLTERARPLLRGEETLELALPKPKPARKARRSAAEKAGLAPADLPLFEALRTLRKELADAQGKPPYVIFGDAALLDMCRMKPTSEAAFLAVNGVGQAKLERYGTEFMAAIAAHREGAAAG